MPNYQNNMRYGRQGNMRQPCGSGYGMQRSMPQTESRCSTSGSNTRDNMQRGEDTCCASASQSENECRGTRENTERRGRDRRIDSCSCWRDDPLRGMPLTMAYVPWQPWGDIYDLCEGFQAGTIFEDLDKPFLGRGGWKQ